jgi:hypothetical protein
MPCKTKNVLVSLLTLFAALTTKKNNSFKNQFIKMRECAAAAGIISAISQ